MPHTAKIPVKIRIWVKSCLVLLLSMAAGLQLQAAPADLEQILEQMSRKGNAIQSMRSNLVQKKWTELLEEFDEGENGFFLFLRKDNALYIRKDILKPQPNSLVIGEGKLIFYQPLIKQAQQYEMGENRDKAEFLLLGFGGSREALEEAYSVRLLGEEDVLGRQTYVLELVPRSDRVSAFFTKIVLWVDAEMWLPVQQKLLEPTDDYLLVSFSDIEVNPGLARKDFELKLPKGTRIVGN